LENPDDIMVIEDMETIFEEWRDRVAQEEGNDEATIIYDEMIRRGLCPNTKTTNNENKYRRYIIGIQEKSQEEVVPPSAEKQKEKKVKDKTAVLYYMLKDKLDTVLMQKVIHYACTPQKEYKGAYPNDTIYTYVSHPEKLLDKMDRIDYVKEAPIFQVSPTHWAKTWLLSPLAPKVEKPKIIRELHERMKGAAKELKRQEGDLNE
jgi:hypothetical protein